MAKARKKKASPKAKPKKKKPVARATPKVSAERGKSVGTWAKEQLTSEQQQILAVLLELMAEEAADADHVIKWAQPVWQLNGPFAYFKPSAKHVTFGFWRGGELDDPEGMLEGAGDRMKHVKLRGPHDARHPAVRRFVKDAVKLNRAKGDPTRR